VAVEGGGKIVEEADRNFIGKGGNRKKDGNDGIWILTRVVDLISDRSKSSGPME